MIPNLRFKNSLVLIKGAGDLASGIAYRLKRSGFPLVMTELPAPLLVRRTVCFGNAVYSGQTRVEGITAQRVETPEAARQLAVSSIIPILIDAAASAVAQLKPKVVVDAIMAKVNTGTSITDATLVIALGPGFSVGRDCHAIIETNRGHNLGRVITSGSAEADTKTPSIVKAYSTDRVLRAPVNGHVKGHANIGDRVKEGQLIASIKGHQIHAPFDGVLRGLIHPAVQVSTGLKIGDLDPRGAVEHCFTISDKSLAVGGGVLEAILSSKI